VPAHPRPGTMAGRRDTRAPGLLRGARQQRCGECLPHSGDTALARSAAAPQPADPGQLGQDEPHRDPVDTPDPHRASIPAGALRRHAPKAGAQCGSSARWDLCGGPPARAVPTAPELRRRILMRRAACSLVIHAMSPCSCTGSLRCNSASLALRTGRRGRELVSAADLGEFAADAMTWRRMPGRGVRRQRHGLPGGAAVRWRLSRARRNGAAGRGRCPGPVLRAW
jgi:hypothetical protein